MTETWIEKIAKEAWKIHELERKGLACRVGKCRICGISMQRDYNSICDNHSQEEISDYYDAIEY